MKELLFWDGEKIKVVTTSDDAGDLVFAELGVEKIVNRINLLKKLIDAVSQDSTENGEKIEEIKSEYKNLQTVIDTLLPKIEENRLLVSDGNGGVKDTGIFALENDGLYLYFDKYAIRLSAKFGFIDLFDNTSGGDDGYIRITPNGLERSGKNALVLRDNYLQSTNSSIDGIKSDAKSLITREYLESITSGLVSKFGDSILVSNGTHEENLMYDANYVLVSPMGVQMFDKELRSVNLFPNGLLFQDNATGYRANTQLGYGGLWMQTVGDGGYYQFSVNHDFSNEATSGKLGRCMIFRHSSAGMFFDIYGIFSLSGTNKKIDLAHNDGYISISDYASEIKILLDGILIPTPVERDENNYPILNSKYHLKFAKKSVVSEISEKSEIKANPKALVTKEYLDDESAALKSQIAAETTERQCAVASLQGQLNAVGVRVASLEKLGHYVGSFDTLSSLPNNISAFNTTGITENDFTTIRADETHNNLPARYIAIDIDESSGEITWKYDLTYSADVSGKADISDLEAETSARIDANDATNARIDEHTSDSEIHITENERTNWNGKTDAADFNAHNNDNTRHITATERTNWNNAATTASTANTNANNALARGLPTGGSAGQILMKNTSNNYDVNWINMHVQIAILEVSNPAGAAQQNITIAAGLYAPNNTNAYYSIQEYYKYGNERMQRRVSVIRGSGVGDIVSGSTAWVHFSGTPLYYYLPNNASGTLTATIPAGDANRGALYVKFVVSATNANIV